MGAFLSFFCGKITTEQIIFALKPGTVESLHKAEIDTEDFFAQLTSQSSLCFVYDRDKVFLFTGKGCFSCVESEREPGVILLKKFYESSLRLQNLALANGQMVRADEIYVKVTVPDYPSQFFFNGAEINGYDIPTAEESCFVELKKLIVEASKDRNNEIREKSERNRKYAKILETAESYAEIIGQYENTKAITTPPLIYSEIRAVENDNRIDRLRYAFVVNELSEENYKVGAQVVIEGNTGASFSAEIIGITSQGDSIEIEVLLYGQVDMANVCNNGRIRLAESSVIADVQSAAVSQLRFGKSPAVYMADVLGKSKTLDISEHKVPVDLSKERFNHSQIEAVKKAINVDDIFLIMGPPGTGKTEVITELVKHFVLVDGKRVLISSQNNTAIDTVLNRLADVDEIKGDVLRIGTESRVKKEITPFLYENKVRELREGIRANSSEVVSKLTEYVQQWEPILEEQKKCKNAEKGLNQKEARIIKAMRQELVPQYEKAKALFNEYLKAQERENTLLKSIAVVTKEINEYTRYLFIGLITDIWQNERVRRKEKYIEELRKVDKRLYEVINEYNVVNETFQKNYGVWYYEFLSYYTENLKFQKDFSSLEKKARKIAKDNEFGLFGFAKNKSSWDQAFPSQIESEIDKIYELQGIMGEWDGYVQSTQNYAFGILLLESVRLVGATCIGINSQKRFTSLEFDVAIIDEAGQIQLQNALVPMSVASKTIMLGDYQQIPPSTEKEVVDQCREHGVDVDFLKQSLFEYLYANLPDSNKIMLDTQYRVPSQIADVLSSFFYAGKYHSSKEKCGISGRISVWNTPCIIVDTSEEGRRFETNKKVSGKRICYNELEAKAVAYIIRKLARMDVFDEKEINVIAPYKDQVKMIRKCIRDLAKEDKALSESLAENVNTLDSYQGQQSDLIIYSFTRSSKTAPQKPRIGFLNELRRLNVALSRCRQNLILIGDMNFLSSCEYQERNEDGEFQYENSEKQFSDFMKELIHSVRESGTYITCSDVVKDFGDTVDG